ncbi:MAG: hypothetical protein E7234_10995 [Lachnospiraceae bacterium]|nr:hypothetical protein [Lachnospiraceae bacterium]
MKSCGLSVVFVNAVFFSEGRKKLKEHLWVFYFPGAAVCKHALAAKKFKLYDRKFSWYDR